MPDLVPAVAALAALSGVLALPHLYRVASFIWLYFLRPTTIHKFLHGGAPYAIVTGATDGIGKATAAELLRNGFNLILHGRNEAKMEKVVAHLRAQVPEKPDADIRYFLADASQSGLDYAKLIEPFKDLQITLVFHNVGGSDVLPHKYVFISSLESIRALPTTHTPLATHASISLLIPRTTDSSRPAGSTNTPKSTS